MPGVPSKQALVPARSSGRALGQFQGTMLLVLHDRTFLKGLGTRVLELEYGEDGKRRPHLYAGSYLQYVQKTGHEAPGVHA